MIYMTEYNPRTAKCTAASGSSGFETLDDVKLLMGEPTHTKPVLLMYVQAEDKGIVFSKVPFRIDREEKSDVETSS